MDTFFFDRGAFVVLAFAAVTVPTATAFGFYFWYKLRREQLLVSLKQELADRGMGADEIRAVVEASPPGATSVAEDLGTLLADPAARPARPTSVSGR